MPDYQAKNFKNAWHVWFECRVKCRANLKKILTIEFFEIAGFIMFFFINVYKYNFEYNDYIIWYEYVQLEMN